MNSDKQPINQILVKIPPILNDFQSDLSQNPSKLSEPLRNESSSINLRRGGAGEFGKTVMQSDLSKNPSKLNKSLRNECDSTNLGRGADELK